MVAEAKKASLIAARDLPKIVDAAVHAAGIRLASNDPLVVRWDLAGKVVKDFAEGQKFADAVAKHVTAGGIDASPAVLLIDKRIIAGFFERVAIPQIRNL